MLTTELFTSLNNNIKFLELIVKSIERRNKTWFILNGFEDFEEKLDRRVLTERSAWGG
jgi:hypothetical protein